MFIWLTCILRQDMQEKKFNEITINIISELFIRNKLLLMIRLQNLQMRLTLSRLSNTLTTKKTLISGFSTLKYFQQKQQVKRLKFQNSFKPEEQILRQKHVNLKDLVPNFFSTHLPLYQCQKIIVSDKKSNYLENSYIQWVIPISQRQDLKNSLIKFRSNQLRIGRILQIMDSVAGFVGYRHCFGSVSETNPCTIVTGSVDSFHLFEKINATENIKIEGFLNYVGNTSMEVEINLYQGGKLKSNSLFMMISRDSTNLSKGYPVPKLILDNLSKQQHEKAIKRYEQAVINTRARKKQMAESYQICPPSQDEIKQLHQQFLNHRRSLIKIGIPIRKTVIDNVLMMHLQERNIHGKIFGGFLMRQMLQIGWISAKKFIRDSEFSIQDLTNVYFKQAVQVGSLLKLVAGVTFVDKQIIVVTVEAYTFDFNSKIQKMSCYLHMVLRSTKQQQKVFPETYEESLAYLSSKKACQKLFDYR